MRRERRAALPFTPHPLPATATSGAHKLAIPPGARRKRGVPEGAQVAQGHQPRAPSSPTDPPEPGAGNEFCKKASILPAARERTRICMYIHTHTEAYIHKYTRIFREGREMGCAAAEKSANCLSEPPFQLTLGRIEPLDTRTQPNAALTYLHTARKSSHC